MTVPAQAAESGGGGGRSRWKLGLGGLGIAFVVVTFVFFLPKIADYRDVWAVLKQLSWPWIVALVVVTAINVASFAPPWMVALPGLSFIQALEVTQSATAISIVVPGGPAAGAASSFAILRSWGFMARDVTRAVTLTSLWNQFLNLSFPIVAVFLLAVHGDDTRLLALPAFIGAAVLGIVVSAFVVALVSDNLARDVGDLAARVADWLLAKAHRGPVAWDGGSFERFREDAGDFVARRWHLLTAASLFGSLTVFLVLLVSLRALNVPATQVSAVEAFAAWALVRIIASIPITPGGIGVVELGLTSALVGFGGNNAGVVAAVLMFRFLTMVPTLILGAIAAATFRRHRPAAA